MQLIGLTGGIATGKSTVSRHLQAKGVPVVDADLIAKQVTLPGQPAYKQVAALFPECILAESQLIDRAKLGKLVFANPDKRKVLEQAVHPAVLKEMVMQIILCWLQGHPRIIVDVPLLYESGLDRYMNYVVVLCRYQASRRWQMHAGVVMKRPCWRDCTPGTASTTPTPAS